MESFSEALDWLKSLPSEQEVVAGKRQPSLVNIKKAFEAFGYPDRSFAMRIIIGGSAGKGTVCRRIERTLLNEGKTVACLSSPHLSCVTERVRINGKQVTKKAMTQGFLRLLTPDSCLPSLTQYEVLVLVGVLLAQEAGVEYLVAEVGLGGEWDAVNALSGPRIAAVTFIGSDHQNVFGSLEETARTKAGIFTEESVLNVSYEGRYRGEMRSRQYGVGSREVLFVEDEEKLLKKISEKILGFVPKDIPKVDLPARWELFNSQQPIANSQQPTLILDGAHSASRFHHILPKIQSLPSPPITIIGMSEGHEDDISALSILFPHLGPIIFTGDASVILPSGRRLINAKSLVEAGSFPPGRGDAGGYRADPFIIPNPQKALTRALTLAAPQNTPILITGSLYLCGEMKRILIERESA